MDSGWSSAVSTAIIATNTSTRLDLTSYDYKWPPGPNTVHFPLPLPVVTSRRHVTSYTIKVNCVVLIRLYAALPLVGALRVAFCQSVCSSVVHLSLCPDRGLLLETGNEL